MTLREAPARPREAAAEPGRAGLRVLMTPDYRRDNPYQELLARALEELDVRVSFPRGYRRALPLRRMLRQDGALPDVLHLHWLAPYLKGRTAAAKSVHAAKLLLDLVLVRRAGVRLVWTVHNLVGHEQTHPGIELWCRRRLARLADAIIVHDDVARDLVIGRYGAPAGKISVIAHGHYRDVYGPPVPRAEARARLGLPQEGRVFLFFGMIRAYKGLETLVAAWAAAPELHERHVLVIAGEVRDAAYWQSVKRIAETAPNIRLFLGRVPDHQVASLHSAADVVVLPFERMLTSGSLVLAQSFHKTVVLPDLESLGSSDRAAAVTYSPRQGPKALRAALAGLIEDDREAASSRSLVQWSVVAAKHKRILA